MTTRRFRWLYWFLLSAAAGYLAVVRRSQIFTESPSPADIVLLITSAALLFAPIVPEISAGGITIKNSLGEVTKELESTKKAVESLSTAVLASMTQRQSQSQVLFAGESVLSALRTSASAALHTEALEVEMTASQDVNDFFLIRHNVEGELRRLYAQKAPGAGRAPMDDVVRTLIEKDAITRPVAELTSTVMALASSGEQGESLSTDQRQFVSEVGRKLLATLRFIPG